MNPTVKAKWLAALRSGEYKQGTGRLRTADNRFCCLGVLCNIHAQEHPDFAATQMDHTEYDGGKIYPSYNVMQWAGISMSIASRLASMNDKRFSFVEIAKYIGDNLR